MILRKCGSLRSFHYLLFHARNNSSGYKINPENYSLNKLKANYTEEDVFQEKVDIAVLKKAKSHLRGFEKITYQDISKKTEGTNPNTRFKNDSNIPKYRSAHRYFNFAERERSRQHEEGVWWKNLDYWIKKQEGDTSFTNIGRELTIDLERRKKLKEAEVERPGLEKSARERTLILDPETVNEEWKKQSDGIHHFHQIAHHYNIYKDLFGNFDFLPVVNMEIEYECSDDLMNPVYYGNELLPSETETQPIVAFDADPEKFYTLLLTNPDEHLEDNDREYAHWLVGNIPGNDVTKGETLVDYLRPFPARGTGFQRMVFVLFQQDGIIDYSSERRETPCTLLCDRDFKTSAFYEKYQSQVTPVSLRFFQCKWEYSVKNTYHDILNMPEPVYEYAKLSQRPRFSALKRNPSNKTMQWLARFMPKELVYPDGNHESTEIRRNVAVEVSTAPEGHEKRVYPVKNLY